jgi:diaminopimelate epimerase
VTPLRYLKGHGTENDFVLLPDPDGLLTLDPDLVAAICDRRSGIGGDGILRVVRTARDPAAAPHAGAAEWFMDYRNADGSIAEMCGNGARVFARYLVDAGLAAAGVVPVATRGGVRLVRVGIDGDVTVEMGPATFPGPAASSDPGLQVAVEGRRWSATAVDMGNPHAVVFVDALGDAGPLTVPPVVTPAEAFVAGVNVEFVVSVGVRHIAMRVHERGSGETRSCGTGACAAMAAAARRDGVFGGDEPVRYTVDVPGGRLAVTRRLDGQVELSGPAVLVAEGELRPEWVASATRSLTRAPAG